MPENLSHWNARYRSREEHDPSPAPLLVEAVRGVAPGRALDLACGAGRNAVWLAEQGWEVVAIDGASEAIRILRERDARVDGRVIDLESGAPLPFADDTFDLVAILHYHYRPLFREAQRVVKPGGLVVCSALLNGTFRAETGELENAFADFDIVLSREQEIAELVARRRA